MLSLPIHVLKFITKSALQCTELPEKQHPYTWLFRTQKTFSSRMLGVFRWVFFVVVVIFGCSLASASPHLEVLLFSDVSAGWWSLIPGWLTLEVTVSSFSIQLTVYVKQVKILTTTTPTQRDLAGQACLSHTECWNLCLLPGEVFSKLDYSLNLTVLL